MNRRSATIIAAAWLLGTTAAPAHHSFSPVYDGGRTVTVTGVVTWEVEFDGRLDLTNGGWNDATITAGEQLRVTGNPTHTGSPRLFFVQLERADGTVLLRPGLDKIQSLEEERRQRAAARGQPATGDR